MDIREELERLRAENAQLKAAGQRRSRRERESTYTTEADRTLAMVSQLQKAREENRKLKGRKR